MATNPEAIIDPYSLCTVHLTMCRDDLDLSVGTGFLWRSPNSVFPILVTCWHCLTGTNPLTGDSLSPRTGARPNKIKMAFRTSDPYQTRTMHQHLYSDNDVANWFVHPTAREQVDIAAFPLALQLPEDVIINCINDLAEQPMRIDVGSELYVLGHPRNMGIVGLPVWKRASLASEPALFQDSPGLRNCYIDTATREGMSGAPVLARSYGTYLHESQKNVVAFSKATRFLGLYSGRIGSENEFGAQLGIIWPRQLIETVIEHGIVDQFELDGSFQPHKE